MKKTVLVPQPPKEKDSFHCDLCEAPFSVNDTTFYEKWFYARSCSIMPGGVYDTDILLCPACAPAAKTRLLNK